MNVQEIIDKFYLYGNNRGFHDFDVDNFWLVKDELEGMWYSCSAPK